jgi:hypothetical protein
MDEGADLKDLSNFEPSSLTAFGAGVSSTFAENPLIGLGADYATLQNLNRSGGGQRSSSMYRKRLSRDEAMEQVKASGQSIDIPESGYTQEALDFLIERKRLQQERASITDRTSWGLGSIPRGIGMLAAGMVDPTSWIPGVRPAVALPTAAARSFMVRAGERATMGAIEGSTAAAAIEPFSVALKYGIDDDYTFADSLINVGFGAAMGGVLAPTVGAVADRMRGETVDVPAMRNEVASEVQGDEIAPTARPEQPSAQALRTTDLPEFKAWFGDSKVADNSGNPLRHYIGMPQEMQGDALRPNILGLIFTTPDTNEANAFAIARDANVLPVYVKAENPFDPFNETHLSAIDAIPEDNLWDSANVENEATITMIKAAGFDGLYVKDRGSVQMNLAVFKPEQIKSAIGNSGKFDPNSASLTDPLQLGEVSPFRRQQDLKTAAMYAAVNDFNNGKIPNVEQVLRGEQPTPQVEAEPNAIGDTEPMADTPESEPDELLSNAMADVQAIQTSLENEGMKIRPIAEAFKAEDAAIARAKKIGEGLMQAVLCRARR